MLGTQACGLYPPDRWLVFFDPIKASKMSTKLMFAVACTTISGLGMADGGKGDGSSVPTVQESRRNSLKGLAAVYLQIEPLGSEARDAGLSASQLRTDIELRLRSAGIPVLTNKQGSEAAEKPYLNLQVVTLRSEAGFSVFIARLALFQHVLPAQNPERVLLVPTWAASEIGYTMGSPVSAIRKTIQDSTDRFCNDYLAVNQKDPTGKQIPFDFKYTGPHKACVRWGKPENYVAQLIGDYNKMSAHFSEAEVLHAAKQACKERVTNANDLVDCRDCVAEIVTALYEGKGGR